MLEVLKNNFNESRYDYLGFKIIKKKKSIYLKVMKLFEKLLKVIILTFEIMIL